MLRQSPRIWSVRIKTMFGLSLMGTYLVAGFAATLDARPWLAVRSLTLP